MPRSGYLSFAVWALTVAGLLATHAEVSAAGLPPLHSDSACSAHVPGWQPTDYVRACSQLIQRLKDTIAQCDAARLPPEVDRDRADPRRMCASPDVSKRLLAAAYNDRAYFLILCRGADNYRAAITDLTAASELLPGYTVAIRNRGIAKMLLADYAGARDDFRSVVSDLADSVPDQKLIRATDEAEARLGLGYAHLGLCEVAPSQNQLVEVERLSLGPIGADVWLRAASLFGQGLGLKVKGTAQGHIAATNTAVTEAERARLKRYATSLMEQGAARMQAARALVRSIDADIRDRFYIEELVLVSKCRNNPASA